MSRPTQKKKKKKGGCILRADYFALTCFSQQYKQKEKRKGWYQVL
jgi:hypothetical protein